jgi:hypothetical protein
MCENGSWRSFTSIRVDATQYVLQQCETCETNRAIPLDVIDVVSNPTAQQPSQDDSDGPVW